MAFPFSSITPTDEQAAAVRALVDRYQHAPRGKLVLFLSGYAGTGESTVVRVPIDKLGLDIRSAGGGLAPARSGP